MTDSSGPRGGNGAPERAEESGRPRVTAASDATLSLGETDTDMANAGVTGESGRTKGKLSWRELLAQTTLVLANRVGAPADLEARWIIEEASGLSGTAFHLDIDALATPRGVALLDDMVRRRLAGEPVQYVLGHWSFRNLDLLVDKRVLIPRPETEQVAEVALIELDNIIAGTPLEDVTAKVVDLGTGSGALALAIATERPGVEVWAVEVDPDALAVARTNLAGLASAGSGVHIVEGSWFDGLPAELRGRIDLVVSNPPYVGATEDLPAEVVDWEPTGALVGGPVGTEPYVAILDDASQWLAPHGVVVFEIGETQGDAVAELARTAGFVEVTVHQDLAGRDRIVVGKVRNPSAFRS